MHRIEFTIEPFREGHPAPYVTEAIAVAERLGAAVTVEPFGTVCEIDAARSGEIVAAVVATAFSNGADRINIDVSAKTAP